MTVDGERFVLRIPGADTDLLGIDRANEYRAASAAADAGVGPEVVAFLPDDGNVFVTRFVPGDPHPGGGSAPRGRAGSGGPLACARSTAARRSRRASRCSASSRTTRGSPPTGASRVPPAYDDAAAIAGRIEAAFSRAPAPLTTCHDDLLNANFLLDGDHVWIVDYEYAGMGDPFFDLANLSVNNGLDAQSQELLLRHYFGEVRDATPGAARADAPDVRLPRGDVGRRAAGDLDARRGLRRRTPTGTSRGSSRTRTCWRWTTPWPTPGRRSDGIVPRRRDRRRRRRHVDRVPPRAARPTRTCCSSSATS